MYSLLSVIALTIGVLVVSSSNTVYALIYLIGLFITIAGLLISIGITYIGLLYIVVYVGAIAILFLFVVMMINVRDTELNTTGNRYTQSLPLTVILGSIFLYLVSYPYNGNLSFGSAGVQSKVPFVLSQTDSVSLYLSNLNTVPHNIEGIYNSDALYNPYSIVESLGIVLYS